MLLTRIVCDNCGGVLRDGDIGAEIEHKTCINCVTQLAPKADLNKVKSIEAQKEISAYAQNLQLENERKRLKQINIELVYKEIDDQWCMVLEMTDYYKQKFAEIGFPKHKLLEMITEIEEIENENLDIKE